MVFESSKILEFSHAKFAYLNLSGVFYHFLVSNHLR
jgi:hypothetical protein